MSAVLDASALLAYLQQEPGGETVKAVIEGAAMSTVNWSEVVQKTAGPADETAEIRRSLQFLGLTFAPFSSAQAETAGRLREKTGSFGLSLGDRACLALGIDTGETVYTADRAWLRLALGVDVAAIR